MQKYVDTFKKPLDKHEVAAVVRQMVAEKRPTTSFITRRFGLAYGKALGIMELLEDAGVVGPLMRGRRSVILKDVETAVNAALRQLKKGNS